MNISLGFSPCPNDTFLFDALLHGRIDTEGLQFDVQLEDVKTLNQRAFRGELDVTEISFSALGHLLSTYQLLDSGATLGNNCGPLLLAREQLSDSELMAGPVAIPGRYTTGNFLLSLAHPMLTNKVEMLFSDIEDAILRGDVVAGLVIHENRFTYASRGLVKLMDCGEYWESAHQLPIPLGGIVVHRRLPIEIQQRINRVIERSVRYALENPTDALPYVLNHAQGINETVMYQHIGLYVNEFSINLGALGRLAVETFFRVASEKGLIAKPENPIFMKG